MAAPLVALPFLAKALAMGKGLVGLGGLAGKAGTVAGVAKAHAAGAAGRAAIGNLGSRMAGSKFVANASSLMPKSAGEWGMRVAPDAIFGTMTAAMTPGDLGDKLIAGGTATAGGALGGLALRGAVGGFKPSLLTPMIGKHQNPGYNGMLDIGMEMVGGIGGDMAAQGVADGILRVKGGGTTPYEKMAAEQQKELEQRILTQYLSGKGGYPNRDPFLAENGLG